MSRIRTFIAVEIPAVLQQKAAKVIRSLSAPHDSMKWVEPQNIHVTFKFLGDVEDAQIYQVCRATADAVADLSSFRVACRGVGAFPSLTRPRTVWLGIDDPTGQFKQLHGRVERAMIPLGVPREVRRFQPHLTLGRLRHGRRQLGNLVERLAPQAEVELGDFDVEELVVFASELTPAGPVYTVLGRAPLSRLMRKRCTANRGLLAGWNRLHHVDVPSLRSARGCAGVVQLIAFDVSAVQRRKTQPRDGDPQNNFARAGASLRSATATLRQPADLWHWLAALRLRG